MQSLNGTHRHLAPDTSVDAIIGEQAFLLRQEKECAMGYSRLICETLTRVGRPGILTEYLRKA